MKPRTDWLANTEGVANPPPRPVDASLVTYGTRAALFPNPPEEVRVSVCSVEDRRPLTFSHSPTYTSKIETGATFAARFFVGNASSCTRRVALQVSFTPPHTTETVTTDFVGHVAPRGAFVELKLDAGELTEANVLPGRYAVTFGVRDEDDKPVGQAYAGHAFRRGQDDVAVVSKPMMPARIGLREDLVVPFAIENRGDTANRVTPLVVFTRPGETTGIEYYEPAVLSVPGASRYTLRLTAEARENAGIDAGSWLLTITTFDAAGDRMNSFAGIPLTIGTIDVRMVRPTLPVRVRRGEALRVGFRFENRGDTKDKVSAAVAFTKPGTTFSREYTFTREVLPGESEFETMIDPAERHEKGIDRGVWLVTVAAFLGSGERIKSFTGHYLEIVD